MPACDHSLGGYPQAERLPLVEEIHGHQVADPYRWLEDLNDPRTQQWCARQDELFSRWQAGWLGDRFSRRLRRRLAALADAGSVSVPVWRGGRQFFTRRGPGQEHEVLLTVSADGAEQVLIDPVALDPAGLTTLDGWSASCEGDRLAYLLSVGGSEQSLLRVMDVTSGEVIDGPVDGTAHAGVAWLPGGTAFYYQRRTDRRTDGAQARLVYLHTVESDPGQDIPVFGEGLDPAAFYVPMVSPDGRWLRIAVDWGTRGVDTYLADLTADGIGTPQFRALQQGIEAISEASFGRDGRIYVLTDRDVPNRRLCTVDADRLDYEHWHTLLPEDPAAVLEDFAILDGSRPGQRLLMALRSRHALSELTLHDLATGGLLAPVLAPGLGTIRQLTGHPDGGPFAWFSYTDDRTPPTVYRFGSHAGAARAWIPSPGHAKAGGVGVSQVTYSSYDGTVVRMFILSPAVQPDRPRPAILYGYGSLGHSRTPAFNPLRPTWVQAGGIYAIANIRGGGEEGQAWHRAGMRETGRTLSMTSTRPATTWSNTAGPRAPSSASTADPPAASSSGPRSPSGPAPTPRCCARLRTWTWSAPSCSGSAP